MAKPESSGEQGLAGVGGGGTEHRAGQGADQDVWWGLSEESTEHAG